LAFTVRKPKKFKSPARWKFLAGDDWKDLILIGKNFKNSVFIFEFAAFFMSQK